MMKRQDVQKIAAIVFGVAVLTCWVLYETRRFGWTTRLIVVGITWVIVLLLLWQEKRNPGRYANFPMGHDAALIFGQAWGRRRRGASRPRLVSGEDATPIVPQSMLAREKVCPTCDAPLPKVAILCPACGALVNPAWMVMLVCAVVLILVAEGWRVAHP
jgi:hypothetical protein